MNLNKKIIIIGFGSIGERHYKNLLKLGFRDVYVFDSDKKKIQGKKTIKDISAKELEGFDVAFICGPNHLHIKHAIECADAGCDLFIEKPLSNNLNRIEDLKKNCKKNRIANMVACNLRFHPCMAFIKKYLDHGMLGDIYSMRFEFGYFLPFWRKDSDYRKNYAIKKSTGGGIILDAIHEFDLLFWLNNFNIVKESKFHFGKVSDITMDTEDICVASFMFSNKVLGTVQCDYLQKRYTRRCKIVGSKGNLEWDFNENIVWFLGDKRDKKLFEVKKYDINSMYMDEIKYFFDCASKRKNTFNEIRDAEEVLQYCVKRS